MSSIRKKKSSYLSTYANRKTRSAYGATHGGYNGDPSWGRRRLTLLWRKRRWTSRERVVKQILANRTIVTQVMKFTDQKWELNYTAFSYKGCHNKNRTANESFNESNESFRWIIPSRPLITEKGRYECTVLVKSLKAHVYMFLRILDDNKNLWILRYMLKWLKLLL